MNVERGLDWSILAANDGMLYVVYLPVNGRYSETRGTFNEQWRGWVDLRK